MHKIIPSAALALLLAACGGGGGGSPATATAPAPASTAVQINDTTAQAVAAHALDTAQNTSTQGAAGMVAGVQVASDGSGAPSNLLMADIVTAAAQTAAAVIPPVAMGVDISHTAACSGGGTVSGVGAVTDSNALTVGDNLTLTATNCVLPIDGTPVTINGSLGISITGGGVPQGATTFHVVMVLTANNFTATSSGAAASLNGDMTFDLTKSSATSASLVVSGKSLATSFTSSAGSRASAWTDYRQSISASGASLSATMDNTVHITSSRLNINNATYKISTQTPVQWISGYAPTTGVVTVVGAGNSHLRETFTSTGVVLEIDANGDGVYEKTVNTTVAALRSML